MCHLSSFIARSPLVSIDALNYCFDCYSTFSNFHKYSTLYKYYTESNRSYLSTSEIKCSINSTIVYPNDRTGAKYVHIVSEIASAAKLLTADL